MRGAAGGVVVYGDPAAPDVLKAAQVDRAHVLVGAESDLADKMRVCVAARELNPRLVLVATAASAHERAWLAEFGVAQVCDATDEQTASVVRAIREVL